MGLVRFSQDGEVFESTLCGHGFGDLPLLVTGGWAPQPHCCDATGTADLFGDPVEMFSRASVGRQCDKTVGQLRDPEPLQLSPDRNPRA